MFKLLKIPASALFRTWGRKPLAWPIFVFADIQDYAADINVVIGSHRQPEAVNLTVENFLALEKQSRMHIFLINSSLSISVARRLIHGPAISRIIILSPPLNTSRLWGGKLSASNGTALAAELGSYFGKAPYFFFSHSDMIGYKPNFLSFLKAKLNQNTVLASFTQRHVLPFTGGMIYDRRFPGFSQVDWLPKPGNPYQIPEMETLQKQIAQFNWLDAGEQLAMEAFAQGKRAHICASRGSSSDFFGHALDYYSLTEEAVRGVGLPVEYAPLNLTRQEFQAKYPELIQNPSAWRKCFDDVGDVVFIHRGRGTRRRRNDPRAGFEAFVHEFNSKISG